MKKAAFLFLMVPVLLAFGCQTAPAEKKYAVQLPFFDDFNRADNTSVGGSWNEGESIPGLCSISNNMLKLTHAVSQYFMLVLNDIKPFGNHQVKLVFSGEKTNMGFELRTLSYKENNGYYLSIDDYGIYMAPIIGGSSSSTLRPFSYSPGQVYDITISVTGSAFSMFISNRSTAATNCYTETGIVTASYDYLDMEDHYFGSNAMVINIDEIEVEEK